MHPFEKTKYDELKRFKYLAKGVARFVTEAAISIAKERDGKDSVQFVWKPCGPSRTGGKIWTKGNHLPAFDDSSQIWRCRRCLACSKRGLQGLCPTTWVELGHQVFQLGQILFCRRCGCYSRRRCDQLRSKCRGGLGRSAAVKKRASRLVNGLDPITGRRIGEPGGLSKAACSDTPVGAKCSWKEVHGMVEMDWKG